MKRFQIKNIAKKTGKDTGEYNFQKKKSTRKS